MTELQQAMEREHLDALMRAHADAIAARVAAEALEDLYLRRIREAQAATKGRT